MSKVTKAFLATMILIIGVILILGVFGFFIERQKLVAEGLARANFPYKKYTQEELNKMFPQYVNENVATTQTPEETHRQFIENLKNNNITGAVECCFRRGDWDKNKTFIQSVKDKGLYSVMVGDLSVIEKDLMFDNTATYLYSGTGKNKEKGIGGTMEFIKDSSGKWLIKDF